MNLNSLGSKFIVILLSLMSFLYILFLLAPDLLLIFVPLSWTALSYVIVLRVEFSFVKRTGTSVAHWLAQLVHVVNFSVSTKRLKDTHPSVECYPVFCSCFEVLINSITLG